MTNITFITRDGQIYAVDGDGHSSDAQATEKDAVASLLAVIAGKAKLRRPAVIIKEVE